MERIRAPRSLSDECEEAIRLQAAGGRLALSGRDRRRLALLHAAASAGTGEDDEVLALLTRSFRTGRPIPAYYRYTDLHAFDWFLRRHGDPVPAAAVALDAVLAELAGIEERHAREAAPVPEVIAERIALLAELRAWIADLPVDPGAGATLSGAAAAAAADPRTALGLDVLRRGTGFPMSDRHDEHVFLRSVHACELVFFLIRRAALHAVRAIAAPGADRKEALHWLGALGRYAELPNRIFAVLRTLTPASFMEFREATGDASAVQSLNYHLMELVLYGFDPEKEEVLRRFEHLRPLAEPPLRDAFPLRAAVAADGGAELAAAHAAAERPLLTWRGRHYGFGRRYLADVEGSGGTEGAAYLKRFVAKDYPPPTRPTPEPDPLAAFGHR
ncbi:hypothetical protein J0910_14005 [Nocardiopsis sp. CNT-189]|uniref:tryptophan 2,3-dioxygenase family protein n=1 Tax=Nocardiopsis oceanisediminis TaxID=2816862 RepID=UPI003B2A8D10